VLTRIAQTLFVSFFVVLAAVPAQSRTHRHTSGARATIPAQLYFVPGPSPSTFAALTGSGSVLVSATSAVFSGAHHHNAVRFLGANAHATAQAGPPAQAKLNFYLGNDASAWRRGVATTQSVAFHDVYPGIDAVFHDNAGRIEYDFRLAPGADPSRIRIAFDGVGDLERTHAGALVERRHPGAILQQRPEAWQDNGTARHPVTAGVVLTSRNRIAFVLGAYDRSKPLILDPVLNAPSLVFSTYMGGTQYSGLDSVVVDALGNSYTTGWSDSPDYPVLPAGSSSFRGGSDDIVVSKFDPDGKLLFSTYIGGSAEDEAYVIAFDPNGNLLLTGETQSSNFPIYPAKVFQGTGTNIGDDTAFALKLDPNGNILGSTYIGGHTPNNACQDHFNEGFGIASDPSGNVYVVGQTCTTDFPTVNPIQKTVQGYYACFVTELDPSFGAAIYSTYLGGSTDDYCDAVTVDKNGDAFVTGGTLSSNLGTKGAYQPQFAGGSRSGDAFLAKLTPNGQSIAFYTYLGGSQDDEGLGITLDVNGNIYLTGYTQSVNFPVLNPMQATFGGGIGTMPDGNSAGDVFISELDPTGSKLLYSTYFGSSGLEAAYGIVVDSAGDIYVAGDTTSTDLKTTAGAVQATYGGGQDSFILELAPGGGSIKYLSYLGGSQIDGAYGFAVSSTGNIYLAGHTASANFPLANALNASLTGNEAGFLAMIGHPVQLAPVANAVTNGASFSNSLSPGQLATVFGQTLLTSKNYASNTPLPVTLAGLSVTVNGAPAPLLYADSQQVNFQIPWNTAPGTAQVVIESNAASSAPVSFTVSPTAPGIFTYGNNRAVAQNYPSGAINGPSAPIAAGGVITVYLTGVGPVTVPGSDGVPTPSGALSTATSAYSATLGGQNAPVSFLGLAPYYVGLAQANVSIPSGLAAGDYPLVITIGGAASNAPLVAVQ
jgi:uncharacterized protein (TIGR03437 family)